MKLLPEREEFRWKIRTVGKQIINMCTRYSFLGGVAWALLCGASPVALANPTDGTVTSGDATISGTGTSDVTVDQHTDSVVIDWGSFDIGQGETTTFNQPGTDSIAINRVTNSGQYSFINGNLIANGRVVIINPNGVLIGSHGNVDVGGFIATSADIDQEAFASTGELNFTHAGNADAVVENRGTITIGDEGLGALVAPVVRNSGIIQGRLAKVQLAAADTFAVDFYGDGLLNLAVAEGNDTRDLLVSNVGKISADGGQVLMTAAAASDIVNTVINNEGVIEAHSLVERDGEIILTGAGATVNVSGTLDVSGVGDADGGSIKIGGDYQGGGDLAWADTVNISEGAEIRADAGDNGDGGTIIVWSETATTTRNRFSAKGGSESGDGGLVETSSKGNLDIAGAQVDTSAAYGEFGTWLLDPTNITVDAAFAATIVNALSNVLVQADKNISIAADIIMTTGVDLSFLAGNTISMGNNTIEMQGGNLSMTVAYDAANTTTGNISINNSTILTNGGNFTVDAYNDLTMNGNGGDPLIVETDGGDINLLAGGDFSTTTGRWSTNGGDYIVHGANSVTFQSTVVNTTGGDTPGSISVSDTADSDITFEEFGNDKEGWSSGENGGDIIITSDDVKNSNNNCFKAGGSDQTCTDDVPDPTTEPPTTEPPTTEPPTTEPPTTEPPTTEPPTTEPPTTEPPTTEPPTTEPPTTEPPTTEPPTTEPPTTEPPTTEPPTTEPPTTEPPTTEPPTTEPPTTEPPTTEPPTTEPPTTEPPTTEPPAEEETSLLAPFIEVDPLGRPIISYANQAVVYDPSFEQREILTVDTDVNIRNSGAAALAGIAPAAGDEDEEEGKAKKAKKKGSAEDVANIEPAAGGDTPPQANEPQAQDDIFCANAFLENAPCDTAR